MPYKRYKKDSIYSYTLGIYPTIELLKYRPERVKEIFLHSRFKSNEAGKIIQKLADGDNIKINNGDKIIEKVGAKDNIYVMGVLEKYVTKLAKKNNHVVLVNPADAGNLGTIIRTMLAFGVNDLAVIKPAVDVFNPEVIRASMGAIFSINWQYYNSICDYTAEFSDRGFFPMMTDGEKTIREIKVKKPYSLIFGNESAGLDESYRKLGQSIYIEQSDKVDSLNLAVAVGIGLSALFESKTNLK